MNEAVAKWYADAYDSLNLTPTIMDAFSSTGEGSVSSAMDAIINLMTGTLMDLFQSLGFAIAMLFFIIALVDLSSSDRLTMEFFIKFFSKFVLAIFMISEAPQIVIGCINLGNGICNLLSDVEEVGEFLTWETVYNSVRETLNDRGTGIIAGIKNVVAGLPVLIISLVGLALKAIVYVIAFSRIFELGVRGSFLPVAMGLMSDDGWKGSAGRYIKKFMAVCSQGAVIVMIGYLFKAIAGYFIKDFVATLAVGDLVMMIGVSVACISVMFKSLGFINDVFGC